MWSDNASNIDFLFFEPYCNVVYNMVNDLNNTPVTIGLFGSWGAGKSSLLNFIENKIEKEKHKIKIAPIKINAWLLEGYVDAKIGIVEAVLETIKENQTFFCKVKNEILALLNKINIFKISKTILKTGISIGLASTTGNIISALAPIVTNIGEQIESTKDKDSENIEKTIRQIREEFETILNKSNIDNLVIMIDDLDRCSPDKIIDILEAVKLFLSVKKTTFIFAVDEAILRYSINMKYEGNNNYNNENIAKDYIEKIIQIPIVIPSLSSKDIENYLLLLFYQSYLNSNDFDAVIKELKNKKCFINDSPIDSSIIDEIIKNKKYIIEDKNNDFSKTKQIIIDAKRIVSPSLKGNPRQAKRFLNAFFIKKELASSYFEDIDEAVLAKLMALYLIDENAFRELNKWNSNYIGVIQELKELECDDKFDKYPSWNKEQLKRWIKSNPNKLYTQDLNKYFYLTKEYLNNQEFGTLSAKDREILYNVQNQELAFIDSYLKNIISSNESLDGVINIIINEFINNKIRLGVIASIFSYFEKYRPVILDCLKTVKIDYTISAISSLERMILIDNDIKIIINNNGNIDKKIKERIMEN